MAGFVVKPVEMKAGTFTYRRGKAVMTIKHRAFLPSLDTAMAADRAMRLARTIRDAMETGKALGFALPEGVGAGWSYDDWEDFGHRMVQAELLALVALSWTGVTAADKTPFPLSADAIRLMMLSDPGLYQAWSVYAARQVGSAAEGNVFALSPSLFTAGAHATATDVVS